MCRQFSPRALNAIKVSGAVHRSAAEKPGIARGPASKLRSFFFRLAYDLEMQLKICNNLKDILGKATVTVALSDASRHCFLV